MTTYGVGELSAINAVSGSYSESVPVVHLVGTPSRKAMRNGDPRKLIHHTLADDRMGVYADMAKDITCAQAYLHKFENMRDAAEAYDEALENAALQSKPVYVSLGSDMVDLPVAANLLDRPLNLKPPANNLKAEDTIVDDLLDKMNKSRRPLIIADGLSYPLHLQREIHELIDSTAIPAMSFTSGKGIINENVASWSPALPNTTEYSRTADLVLIFGPILSDTNTARWGAIPDVNETVMFNLDSVEIAGKVYSGIRSKTLLQRVVSRLREGQTAQRSNPIAANQVQAGKVRPTPSLNSRISQDDLWPAMSPFMRPEDTILSANGTPLIGARQIHLPPGCQVIASPIWNAIGSMLPAAQGVAAAKRDHDLPGRTILLEGDGSFQVTVQSVSDIIRYKLDVTIFIANNAGYTYERWLNGKEAEYNDVPIWRYTDAVKFFGAKNDDTSYPVYGRKVETWGELQEVLADEHANDGKGLKIIDIVMDPMDVPESSKPGLCRASEALRSTQES